MSNRCYCPAHDYGPDPGFPPDECPACDALNRGACPDCARLRAEIAALAEKFPCGHRKVDMDDSYGGCVFCGLKKSHDEGVDEEDKLEARAEAAEEKLAASREALTVARAAIDVVDEDTFGRASAGDVEWPVKTEIMSKIDAALSPKIPAAPEPEPKVSDERFRNRLRNHKCPNCGEDGPHFAPPSLGEPGFYICKANDDPHPPVREPAPEPPAAELVRVCLWCGGEVPLKYIHCQHCGQQQIEPPCGGEIPLCSHGGTDSKPCAYCNAMDSLKDEAAAREDAEPPEEQDGEA